MSKSKFDKLTKLLGRTNTRAIVLGGGLFDVGTLKLTKITEDRIGIEYNPRGFENDDGSRPIFTKYLADEQEGIEEAFDHVTGPPPTSEPAPEENNG